MRAIGEFTREIVLAIRAWNDTHDGFFGDNVINYHRSFFRVLFLSSYYYRCNPDKILAWLQQLPDQRPKSARSKTEYTRFGSKWIFRAEDAGRYDWGQDDAADQPPFTVTGFPPELQELIYSCPLRRTDYVCHCRRDRCMECTVDANHVIITRYDTGDHHIGPHHDRQLGAIHPTTGNVYRTGAIAAGTEIANAVFGESRIFRVYDQDGNAVFDTALEHGEVLVLVDNAHTTHEVPKQPGWTGPCFSVTFRYIPNDGEALPASEAFITAGVKAGTHCVTCREPFSVGFSCTGVPQLGGVLCTGGCGGRVHDETRYNVFNCVDDDASEAPVCRPCAESAAKTTTTTADKAIIIAAKASNGTSEASAVCNNPSCKYIPGDAPADADADADDDDEQEWQLMTCGKCQQRCHAGCSTETKNAPLCLPCTEAIIDAGVKKGTHCVSCRSPFSDGSNIGGTLCAGGCGGRVHHVNKNPAQPCAVIDGDDDDQDVKCVACAEAAEGASAAKSSSAAKDGAAMDTEEGENNESGRLRKRPADDGAGANQPPKKKSRQDAVPTVETDAVQKTRENGYMTEEGDWCEVFDAENRPLQFRWASHTEGTRYIDPVGAFAFLVRVGKRDIRYIFYVYKGAQRLAWKMDDTSIPRAFVNALKREPGIYHVIEGGARTKGFLGTPIPDLRLRPLDFDTRRDNCVAGAANAILIAQHRAPADQLVPPAASGFMHPSTLSDLLQQRGFQLRHLTGMDTPFVLVYGVHTVAIDTQRQLVYDPANLLPSKKSKWGGICPISMTDISLLCLPDAMGYYAIEKMF